jgi:hypothetical protein
MIAVGDSIRLAPATYPSSYLYSNFTLRIMHFTVKNGAKQCFW